MNWYVRNQIIDLTMPKIMAIWNVSPDSFSSFCEEENAAGTAHAERLCAEGADILDIGAESTRPGAEPISPQEEIARLQSPLIWAKSHILCPISLDSRHADTIQWALSNELVDIINDVGESTTPCEMRDGAIYKAVHDAGAGLVLMAWNDHDSEVLPFEDCLKKIVIQLENRLQMALDYGIDKRSVVLDPGIGFGKGLDNDMRLIAHAPKALEHLGCPVLIGHSRKRCLARALGLPIEKLDGPTAMASAIAFMQGASIVRVHQPIQSLYARQIAHACVMHSL
ncbi:MAG: dihydropteroate synthase [Proteobacteria bacterium]|nr:dihydropteroate synthase [Pseudomonadota bacterium]